MIGDLKSVAVTGARGMIGRYLVGRLIRQNINVRVLSRQKQFQGQDQTKVIVGSLSSVDALHQLLVGVDTVFHCAAELHQTDNMYETNVLGTDRLARLAIEHGVGRFVHMSSAGVIGAANDTWVDESSLCRAKTPYEVSKLASENALLSMAKEGKIKVCILRPTNVVDEQKPGVLSIALRHNYKDRLQLLFKGNEYAHIIHADDVAAAALHLSVDYEGIYFVGCDEDSRNNVGSLFRLCRKAMGFDCWDPICFSPNLIHAVRRMVRGESLHGKVRFSSRKLIETGFSLPLALDGAVKRVASVT